MGQRPTVNHYNTDKWVNDPLCYINRLIHRGSKTHRHFDKWVNDPPSFIKRLMYGVSKTHCNSYTWVNDPPGYINRSILRTVQSCSNRSVSRYNGIQYVPVPVQIGNLVLRTVQSGTICLVWLRFWYALSNVQHSVFRYKTGLQRRPSSTYELCILITWRVVPLLWQVGQRPTVLHQ